MVRFAAALDSCGNENRDQAGGGDPLNKLFHVMDVERTKSCTNIALYRGLQRVGFTDLVPQAGILTLIFECNDAAVVFQRRVR